MAFRYLRATGNWSGAVWAATSDGAAGSATAPSSDDIVVILANYTVTLDANITVNTLAITNGTFNANNYDVTINNQFEISSGTAKTVNMGSGTWTCNIDGGGYVDINAYNVTLTLGTSRLIINVLENTYIALGNGLTHNDVVINMGVNTADPTTLDCMGSQTFRSLIIQSKNSAAHTVNFNRGAVISVDKFVAIGSSPTNRLKLDSPSASFINFTPIVDFITQGTCYGQNLDVSGGVTTYDGNSAMSYVGTNSIRGSNDNWLLQDPPKISTLVDPLTTAPESNPNWIVDQGTYDGTSVVQSTLGYNGGGYKINSKRP